MTRRHQMSGNITLRSQTKDMSSSSISTTNNTPTPAYLKDAASFVAQMQEFFKTKITPAGPDEPSTYLKRALDHMEQYVAASSFAGAESAAHAAATIDTDTDTDNTDTDNTDADNTDADNTDEASRNNGPKSPKVKLPSGLAKAFLQLPTAKEVEDFVAKVDAPLYAHLETVLSAIAQAIRSCGDVSVPGVQVVVVDRTDQIVANITNPDIVAAIRCLVYSYRSEIEDGLRRVGLELDSAAENGPRYQLFVSYK